ncbi:MULTISPECIES: YihY/virulence factor BrkB family protein [unclassified Polaribacter]|uniref:YihY/virulence factor BrkB family protein n=1 Tax=unclassified Polaribacter TaxID=196858 RepID=UPI0011BE3ED3|nr:MULTISPECIES: YihY/virulence factor BrkB family protein [unclassified Polaribacter]TXD50847.1 YihY/virulence factor BrkB family protein [Polaribacter sp. IC063]TXD57594.1 YihY/virulence factor BrkB family protein [Polaribacter sp. IC066]
MKKPEEKTTKVKFKLTHLPNLLFVSAKSWFNDSPFNKAAIIAYYAILSLPALIIIIFNLVGAIWGREIVEGEILTEISKAIGAETAEAIKDMMVNNGNKKTSIFATTIGIATLIYGSTGVFFQIQNVLDSIWEAEPRFKNGVLETVFGRLKSFGFILIIVFLLLSSLILTSLLSAFGENLKLILSDKLVNSIFTLDIFISLAAIYFIFAAMFKILPNADVPWKAVRIGALLTSFLFVAGKYLLAIYFRELEPGSTYGAAGSMILVMLWVSYTSLILFYGAHFTRAYSQKYLLHQPEKILD